jgi:NADPH2:quinone reductase
MRQVVNIPGPTVRAPLTTGRIPLPGAKQVLIKVIVSGCNPKDWKVPELAANYPNVDDGTFMGKSKAGINQGDDIAGVVEAVGKDVIEFKVCKSLDKIYAHVANICKKGDFVAAFHEMGAPGGSYAEYALAWDWTTFHVPDTMTFEGMPSL